MSIARQSTGVAIGDRAILIDGPPGAGKSSLALALIDRGGVLVGDDSVMLHARGGVLRASPHPNTRGLIEIRNIGLPTLPVRDDVPVALVIALDETAPRYIDAAETIAIGEIALPLVRLWPGGPILALKAEFALRQYGLSLG